MKKIAFVVFIVGICVLAVFLNLPPRTVVSEKDLNELEINEKIYVSGRVVEEKIISGNKKILYLEKGIEIVCECDGGFNDREVVVVGIVSEFDGKKQVEALEIKLI